MGSIRTSIRKLIGLFVRGRMLNDKVSPVLPWPLPGYIKQVIDIVQPYTMLDPLRLAMLYQLAQEIPNEGDVVECGVCNGGSAALLASVVRSQPTRTLWLYDTFQGLPAPSIKDGPYAEKYGGQLVGSVDCVWEVLAFVGFAKERVILRQGLFEESFKQSLPKSIAFLHVDADWYEGVLNALNTFYPLMLEGAVVVLDDFGHWEGTRVAFYDFCIKCNVRPLLERAGYTQVFWRKGAEHNRNSKECFVRGVYGPSSQERDCV